MKHKHDERQQRRHRRTPARKTMNKPQDPEAAETVQTTSVPAVDLPRLVRPSWFKGEAANDWHEDAGHENAELSQPYPPPTPHRQENPTTKP